ncbi:thiamine pyrophosphokinase 1-like protein [Fennellomyces sp. T-0311]|nr:thiamine pyrophosphokinase 1-like protein [Fennellomyces sp. T-0311]
MNSLKMIHHLCPTNIFMRDAKIKQYALIIVNQPIYHLPTFERLWANATLRYCADGGSNRLFEAYKHDPNKREQYLPDEIRGDLDSMRPDVRAYYESKSVKITQVTEQESTDFEKVVALVDEKEKQMGKSFDIVALSGLGGRFDQAMRMISTLFMMKDRVDRRMIIVAEECLAVLLDKGTHQIHCQQQYEGPNCGFIPIGEPSTVTTRGLEWDLVRHKCQFGGMVSSSNHIVSDVIEIETDAPLVWTTELKQGDDDDLSQ